MREDGLQKMRDLYDSCTKGVDLPDHIVVLDEATMRRLLEAMTPDQLGGLTVDEHIERIYREHPEARAKNDWWKT